MSKISVILLVLFVLGVILSGFFILQRNTPTKSVDGYVIPFGIHEAGLAVPPAGGESDSAGGGGPGSPPR